MSFKDKIHEQKSRDLMSQAKLGKTHTEEHNAAISEGLIEHYEKHGHHRAGVKNKPEATERTASKKRGVPMPAEAVAKSVAKRSIDLEDQEKIIKLHKDGMIPKKIEVETGIALTTVYKYINKNKE